MVPMRSGRVAGCRGASAGEARQAIQIALRVRWQPGALRLPQGLAQAFQHAVLGAVFVGRTATEFRVLRADAARLVESQLFLDGDVQPEVQERVLTLVRQPVAFRAGVGIFQKRMVFGMAQGNGDNGAFRTFQRLAVEIPAPLNIVAGLTATLLDAPTLFSLGVKRVSLGGSLARVALSLVERAGRELLESGTLGFLDGAISYAELQRRFAS